MESGTQKYVDERDQVEELEAWKAEELRKLHVPLCHVLHALEAMIPDQQRSS